MFLRKNKEIRIKAMKPYIEVDRGLSREEYELEWKQITKIGDDIILVQNKYQE